MIRNRLFRQLSKSINFILALVGAFALLFVACEAPIYTPKPRAYPKVTYPERGYQMFERASCPFRFEFPTYATIEQNKSAQATVESSCWFDIYVKDFDVRLHCTYYAIKNQTEFEQLWTDAFELASKHNVRADFIDTQPIKRGEATVGFTFDIEGASASPYQFFITDSTYHFLRASLYFNTQPKIDSLAPIYAFLKEDIQHIIATFDWK